MFFRNVGRLSTGLHGFEAIFWDTELWPGFCPGSSQGFVADSMTEVGFL
jgi:hypothetical protein